MCKNVHGTKKMIRGSGAGDGGCGASPEVGRSATSWHRGEVARHMAKCGRRTTASLHSSAAAWDGTDAESAKRRRSLLARFRIRK